MDTESTLAYRSSNSPHTMNWWDPTANIHVPTKTDYPYRPAICIGRIVALCGPTIGTRLWT
jgi:hypothetical protein